MITLKHHIKPFSNCFRPILLVLILGILFTSCQELNCEDFREGEFSHITEGDNSVEGTIVRFGRIPCGFIIEQPIGAIVNPFYTNR